MKTEYAAGEETIIIDFSLEPVLDRGGNIVFLLAEGHNITEKKRAEAEIARKNEKCKTCSTEYGNWTG